MGVEYGICLYGVFNELFIAAHYACVPLSPNRVFHPPVLCCRSAALAIRSMQSEGPLLWVLRMIICGNIKRINGMKRW